MDNRELLQAIDVCRPGSNDLALPELAEAARLVAIDPWAREQSARMQLLDRRIGAAMADVEPPDGLAERILARLGLPRQTTSTAPRSTRWTRRRVLMAVGGAVAAAAAVLIVLAPWKAALPLSPDEAAEWAIDFHVGDAQHEPGQLVLDVKPPQGLPISGAVSNVRLSIRWREVDDFLDAKGVAYDLMLPNGRTATLYVVNRAVKQWPSPPTLGSVQNTQGLSAIAWAEKGLVYVLVVDGEPELLEKFIQLRAVPFA